LENFSRKWHLHQIGKFNNGKQDGVEVFHENGNKEGIGKLIMEN
jgi:hypothetical protein